MGAADSANRNPDHSGLPEASNIIYLARPICKRESGKFACLFCHTFVQVIPKTPGEDVFEKKTART